MENDCNPTLRTSGNPNLKPGGGNGDCIRYPRTSVYLLEEDGINAFAAGYSPADAVVGITRGCAEKLNRDQLQGVIAHEFSHILNGDMRLNIRLSGIIFGIFFSNR